MWIIRTAPNRAWRHWRELRAELGSPIEDTLCQETPTGGLHFLYAADGIADAKTALGPGIEVKAATGYFVAAPSVYRGKTLLLGPGLWPG